MAESFDEIFSGKVIPLDEWIQAALEALTQELRPVFQAVKWPIAETLDWIQWLLVSTPPLVFLTVLFLVAWQVAGLRVSAFTVLAMTFIGLIGIWQATMITLALVLTSVLFCVLVGIPTGILVARNDRLEAVIRPILDAMQTLPAFVYLVPFVMLFGVGNVSGVAVTMFFALPPVIRLTNLAVRQVPANMVEAAYAFGSSPSQVLMRVQLPLAASTIMAGVNQTLMMALAMVVIASMIAVEGLGLYVLRGIGRLDLGLATTGGIGIVLLAMILDRITQALGTPRRGTARWRQGPVGLVLRISRAVSFTYRQRTRRKGDQRLVRVRE